jgi:O-antigen/teichoic acid export membrane protein
MRLAFSFATDLSCQTLSTNLDKLLLAFWYSPYVVGTYSAGYRLLFISAMPIRAVVEATFPHQVKLARNDRRASRYFTANIISLNLALSFAIAGLIFVLAPLATIVLGEDFRDSVGVLRLGAIFPIAQGCNYTLGKYLTATNRQTVRTKVQIIVTATYVGVGLIVIPLHSWKGAIWMAIGSESLLAVLFGFACLVSPQRDITETEGGS